MANFTGTPDDDSLTGTSGDDAMVGLAGNDTIVGLGGADFIHGGLGNDSLVGGDDAAWDTVSYEAGLGTSGAVHVNLGAGFASGADGDDVLVGFERVIGSDFDDTLIGSTGSNDLEGRAGNDSIVGGGGNDKAFYWITSGSGVGVHVSLADGRAYQDGWGGVDTLVGISQIVSSLYNDTLVGNAADNMFRTYTGNDSINGGAGLDQVVYDFSETAVNVNLSASTGTATGKSYTQSGVTLRGTDTLEGIELVVGSNHNDTLTGSTRDTFEMFEGGKGNDTIDGGAITTANNGNRASYQNANGSVTVDLQSGTATGADGSDKLININQIRGSNSADSLYGSNASAYTEFFEGRGGNDFIDGRGGTDVVRYDAATGPVNVDLAGLDGGARGGAVDGQGGFDTLVGIEGIQGTAYNDTLIGGHAQGGVVLTDGLIEFFRGGAGNDTIDGRQGYDRADYDTSTAGVHVDLGADTVNGRGAAQDGLGGIDTLINIEAVRGSSHNDTLIGSDAYFESFEGGAGNDTIDGKGGWDRVDYRYLPGTGVNVNLAGNTATDGQGGTDTLYNIEMVRGSNFNDTLAGDGNANKLEGMGGDDSIEGGDGDDSLEGGGGNDILRGGNGNDDLRGGAGNDTLNGGAGWDWVNYGDATAAVNVNLQSGTATGGGGSDKLSGFEAVAGSNFNDTLTGDANNNDFDGGRGNDRIVGGGGLDRVGYWSAEAAVSVNLATGQATGAETGTDTLVNISGAVGSRFDDALTGNGADNTFEGGEGNDAIDGGAGRDFVGYGVAYGSVNVNLATGTAQDGQGGTDTLANIENIGGSFFADTLVGDGADNSLTGEAGDDAIDGGAGNDWLSGGAGHDTILGGEGSDILLGGGGNDSIDGGAITDRVNYTDLNTLSYEFDQNGIVMNLSGITGDGSEGSGTVTDGWGGTDIVKNVNFIRGSAHNDSILGSSADIFEQFDGGAGNDTIDGGAMTVVDGVVTHGNRVSYQNAGAAVTVSLQAGTASGGAGNDTLSNINHVRGSNFGDSLVGSDATYAELFDGRGGNDTIDGLGGFDIVRYDQAPATAGVNVNLSSNTATDGQGGTDTLINIEGVYGTGFNDTITGNAADNRLEGRGGSDSIIGGAGNDTLIGGPGNDTLDGGAGDDWAGFQYAFGDYTITRINQTDLRLVRIADTSDITIVRNVENFAFSSGADHRTLQDILGSTPSDWGDMLTGTAGDDTMDGGKGDDLINGMGGNDSLKGGDGNDTLDGGEGNDTLEGGLGNDTYVVDSVDDMVVEAANAGTDHVNVTMNAGTYVLTANVENATVTLNGTLVNLTGNNLANKLIGNDTDNLLDGGGGNDTMTGGLGDDAYVVDALGDVVVEQSGQGTDLVLMNFAAAGTYTLGLNVENGTITTANTTLKVNLTGNGENNRLTGNGGNNVLLGLAGDDTLIGGGGSDTIDGGADTDTVQVQGQRGDYSITRTGTGANEMMVLTRGTEMVTIKNVEFVQFEDTVEGYADLRSQSTSDNPDVIAGTPDNDNYDGRGGDDSISGLAGDDVLAGGAGKDTLDGGDGKDTLIGGDGDDRLIGGAGDDSMEGGAGNDTYDVDSVGDEVVELAGKGTDTVNVALAAGAYTLGDNVENAVVTSAAAINLTGNGLANKLTGNDEANELSGGAGADTLDGGAGNDTLLGGTGADKLIGGDGDDTYEVDVAGDTITEAATAGAGTDTVLVNFAAAGTYTLGLNVENGTIITSNPALKVNLTGNAGHNILTGNAGDNVLNGGTGDDTLSGGGGNDTLDGGLGSDVAVFDGAFADYTVERLTAATEVKLTHIATNKTTLVRNVEQLQFADITKALAEVRDGAPSAGKDTIIGTSGADVIYGLAGDDKIDGKEGDDLLDGGLGNDTLLGGEGNDSMVGGAGNDTYEVDSAGDEVVELTNGGTDTVNVALAAGTYTLAANVENAVVTSSTAVNLTGNDLANKLTGNSEANELSGGAGADTLEGGAGNDTLIGGAGADKLFGGAGDDTYEVDVAGDAITEAATAGAGTADTVLVNFTTAGTYTLGLNVENGTIITSNTALLVNLTGNAGNNVLTGNAGNNVLNGGTGNDTLDGGDGNDTLDGGTGNDTAVFADDLANYTVDRPAGTDVRLTHTGGGITIVRNVESFVFNGGAAMTVAQLINGVASAGNDSLTGTSGDDTIDGLAGNDTLTGLDGNDSLIGGAGTDSMVGGLGDDTYVVDAALDKVVELSGQGHDLVEVAMTSGAYTLALNVEDATVTSSGAVSLTGNGENNLLTGNAAINTLRGGLGNDTLEGLGGNDLLYGDAGEDLLIGGIGNDKLDGGAGNDTLMGGEGKDTLTGGAGADKFVLDTAPISTANADSITDFKIAEGDKIQLSVAVFTGLGGAGDPVNLSGGYLSYNQSNGNLVYDADGAGFGAAGITIAILGTRPVLTVDHIELIA